MTTQVAHPKVWRHLSWFFGFRLLLALLLLFGFLLETGPAVLGQTAPLAFGLTSIGYLLLVIGSGLLLRWRRPAAEQQAHLMVFVDIAAITLLMHASGGVQSGLGMLLLVSIAGGSLLMEGQAALLFAALASLAILSEQVYSQFAHAFQDTAYTQAGILGAAFFAVALLAHVLSLRIRETERLATQRGLDLANMAQLNEYVIQHMRTGILAVDDEQRIRLINGSARELLGRTRIAGGQPLAQACPELARRLAQWRRSAGYGKTEVFHAVAGGREVKPGFAGLGSDGAAGTLIFLEDNAALTQQAQQMKLASLGRLTASIAHEIRNPLGAISHAGQLMEESPGLAPEEQRLTEIIRSNSARVNEIIENVLQLSRRQPSRTRLLELCSWLAEFVAEFQRDHELTSETLGIDCSMDGSPVRTDPGQLRQLLTILMENSLQHAALPDRPLHIQLRSGRAVETGGVFLDIIDNGPGIEPAIARQMFEPFFTTHNSGSGLGLYIAQELCESNQMGLEYLAGKGSRFRIRFPDPRKRELRT